MAACDAIKETDMADVMKGMLERAKKGDIGAVKFVMGFIATGGREGTPENKQIVLIQQNAGQHQPPVNMPAGMIEKYAEDGKDACERCNMDEREPGGALCMTCRRCEQSQKARSED